MGRAAAEGLERGRPLQVSTSPELPDAEFAEPTLNEPRCAPDIAAEPAREAPGAPPLGPSDAGAAWDRFLAVSRTEGLTVEELARHFGFGRNRMAALLPKIAGAERLGSRWRVPVREMPPAYWVASGLLLPVTPTSPSPAPFGRGTFTSD